MGRSKEDIAKMTVVALKAALGARGLPQAGKKDELVDRLYEAEQADSTQADAAPAAVDDAKDEGAPAAEEPANASAQPAQEEAPARDKETRTAEAPAQPEQPSKHAKIEFTEQAAKAMPDTKKIVVINKPPAQPAKPPVKSEAEKLKERADRFKDPEVEKAKQRAARFGISHPELDKEKLVKRAERFGISHPELDEAKKKARAERFGIVDPAAKLAARAEKFKPLASNTTLDGVSVTDFEARKKARAARFNSACSLSEGTCLGSSPPTHQQQQKC